MCEIFPDAGTQPSADCLPTFSGGFADLIKSTWGANLRLDLIISNIITAGKSIVVEPGPQRRSRRRENPPDPCFQAVNLRPITNETLALNKCLRPARKCLFSLAAL